MVVELRGARITDRDAGLVYEATIGRRNGRVWLTSQTVLTTTENQRIDQAAIRKVPVQRIAEQVAHHLAEEARAGMPVFSEAAPLKGERPSTQQVARDWRQGLGRAELATAYGFSPYTVDDWLREARDAGLSPPATTGRKRKKEDGA